MKVKRICKRCGKEFYIVPSAIKKGEGKFCSVACFALARREREKVTCLQCGKTFFTVKSKLKKNQSKYCSKECVNLAHRTGEILTCPVCKKEFYVQKSKPSKGYGKYCSHACACIGRKDGETCVCLICGKEFYVNTTKLRQGRGKYCSKECANLALKSGEKVQCTQCGKIFYVKGSKLENNNNFFCTQECLRIWQSEHRGKNNTQYKEKIKKNCAYCGKELLLHKSHVMDRNFCSKVCMGKWRAEHWVGKTHPAWQGGLSYEPYCEKFNEAFKERIRDKFDRKCFICGKTEEENGQKLSVHHVNYSKDCLCDDEKTCQFVPLCASGHAKTNFNRDYWEVLIMNKLRSRLDGYYI